MRERESGRERVQCSSSVCVCVCVREREVVVPFETSIGCTAIILRCSNRSRTALTCGRQSIHIGQQKKLKRRASRHAAYACALLTMLTAIHDMPMALNCTSLYV